MNKPLQEYRSSTGGTVQVFTWGLRHIAGRVFNDNDNDNDDDKSAEVGVTQPRKRGRPRKNP
jgi:hypothetical protein